MPLPSSGQAPPIPTTDLLSSLFSPEPNSISGEQPVFISAEHFDNSTQVLSHSQCYTLIRQLIAGISSLPHFRRGSCIALHSFNSVYYAVLQLAIIGAGGIVVGTNPAYTKYELEHTLKTSGARYVLCEPELELLEPIQNAMKSCGLNPDQLLILDTRPGQNIPSLSFTSWQTLLSYGERDWYRFSDLQTAKSTTAAFFFSSGTTGAPKAVQLTHHNLIAQHTLIFTPHPRPYHHSIIFAIPLFHAGIGCMTLGTVLKLPGTAIVMRRFELQRYLDLTARFQVKELLIVPPIVDAILQLGLEKVGGRMRSIKYGLLGGAATGTEMQTRFRAFLSPDVVLGQLLGMTETTCIATYVFPGTKEDGYMGSVGKAVPGIEIKLIDGEGRDVSHQVDVRGEICVKGPTVTPGYFQNEAANTELIDGDGWLRGGDLGFLDEKGWLRIAGRSKVS